MQMRRCLRLLPLIALLAGSGALAHAYYSSGLNWASGQIVMHLQLGPAPVLSDGCADWDCVAVGALSEWNLYLDRATFAAVRNSGVPKQNGSCAPGTCANNVFFDSHYFGSQFDEETLAITLQRYFTSSSQFIETDVVFNTAFTWDSYRGPLRRSEDLYRVAQHEFGHVLGLEHPDEYGQSVNALMNAQVSDIDNVEIDDIRGAYSLYLAGAGTPVNFPARNETVAFRNQLESKYRDGLGRGPTASFVDIEGSVVWIQEYVRYRLNSCDHPRATARTNLQIFGFGVQPTCGSGSGQIVFPPRNEPTAYRRSLEEVYRDTLKRGTVSTFVDLEGDVVWIQEYVRYRLTGCGHADATNRVFAQIDGAGVQPPCISTPTPSPTPSPTPQPGPATLTGLWRGTNAAIGTFTMNLTQNGSVITGTYSDAEGPGQIDPAEPGSIDANGNVVMRVKQTLFTDFTFRGTADPSRRRITGGIFGSGFTGEPFAMDKQ